MPRFLRNKLLQPVKSVLEDAQSYSQVHFCHDMTYVLSSDDTARSPVAFNSSLLGSGANLCEQQKPCPHSVHICLGCSSGPGVSKLQMSYVLCNKGSRWAGPHLPRLYLQENSISKMCHSTNSMKEGPEYLHCSPDNKKNKN